MKTHRILKVLAWVVFFAIVLALNSIGAFAFLEGVTLNLGKFHLSLLTILKTIFLISLLIWVALGLAKKCDERLTHFKHLQPSSQILFSKFIKVILIGAAVFSGLSILGIDISIFAFFAGAFGLGIGFGLQNAFSNLFCGITLLIDRSIKPGDVVALSKENTYGVVNRLNARYVSVRTREGKEHLIPNDYFVTNKVENWSYSDRLIRIPIKICVELDADLILVERLLYEIVNRTDRVLQTPEPTVRFKQIIENAMEVEVRVWINDPEKGISGVISPINLEIWKIFRERSIRFAYPAREFIFSSHLGQGAELIEKLKNP